MMLTLSHSLIYTIAYTIAYAITSVFAAYVIITYAFEHTSFQWSCYGI